MKTYNSIYFDPILDQKGLKIWPRGPFFTLMWKYTRYVCKLSFLVPVQKCLRKGPKTSEIPDFYWTRTRKMTNQIWKMTEIAVFLQDQILCTELVMWLFAYVGILGLGYSIHRLTHRKYSGFQITHIRENRKMPTRLQIQNHSPLWCHFQSVTKQGIPQLKVAKEMAAYHIPKQTWCLANHHGDHCTCSLLPLIKHCIWMNG